MEAKLKVKYKSLTTPLNVNLPDLTILTGVNGSGKTHFLESIVSGITELFENNVILNPKNYNTCKYVNSAHLNPNSKIFTKEQLDKYKNELWSKYDQFLQNFKRDPQAQIQNYFRGANELKVFDSILKESGKEIDKLTMNDFYYCYPIDDGLHNDIFQQNFSTIFKNYHSKYDNNNYNEYLHNAKGYKDVKYLTEEEFVKKYKEAPWNFINKILKEAKLDYHFDLPHTIHRDAPFELKLINNLSDLEIQFGELSSGEKILMSLAFAIYNSISDLGFPKILLIDEPDAFLHPTMVKELLNIIDKVFIKEKGMKVIITTHSPSTVALANDQNIFIMHKEGSTGKRIEKSTRNKALKMLTSGVPSLSINYENRRQIFVESDIDVYFYDKVYDKLKEKLLNEVSLNFISVGKDAEGGDVRVKDIVNTLSKHGNNFIFGIIDWDRKNNSNDFVKVLGHNRRYNIENYIFDPIIISAFLLREKIITREELGILNNENYSDFKNFSSQQLQNISDFLTSKLSNYINSTDPKRVTVKYINGIELQIPEWYLIHNGHDLEESLLKAFSELGKYGKNNSLKKEIISKIIDDIPEFISNDIIELFQQIQEH